MKYAGLDYNLTMLRNIKVFSVLLVLPILSACDLLFMPASAPTYNDAELMRTAVFLVSQTAPADDLPTIGITQFTSDFPPTHTLPASTSTFVPQPNVTPVLEATQIPTIERSSSRPLVTLTPTGWCNQAGHGAQFDITVPDGTEVLPGQVFTKTWHLINTGVCTWTRLYKLIYYSGNDMGAHQESLFGGEVAPGQAVDISIQMTAPMEPGFYQSNWMLMDSDGNLFGMGWNADAPFWVKINVVESLSPTSGQ